MEAINKSVSFKMRTLNLRRNALLRCRIGKTKHLKKVRRMLSKQMKEKVRNQISSLALEQTKNNMKC